jgi:hypothetical protein
MGCLAEKVSKKLQSILGRKDFVAASFLVNRRK